MCVHSQLSRLCVTCVSHPFLLCTATAVWLVSSPVPLFMNVAAFLPHHHSTLEVTWREIPGGRLGFSVPASGGVVGVDVAMCGGCAVQFSFSLPVFFSLCTSPSFTPLPPLPPCGIGHPARLRRPAWGWCCVCQHLAGACSCVCRRVVGHTPPSSLCLSTLFCCVGCVPVQESQRLETPLRLGLCSHCVECVMLLSDTNCHTSIPPPPGGVGRS